MKIEASKGVDKEEGKELMHLHRMERKDADLLTFVKDKGEKDHSFSEIFIHQLIETIEFALGTVSNTASYL